MLHAKVFHVNKKKFDAAQKSISCRQKQNDAASKKYFVRTNVINFFLNGAPGIEVNLSIVELCRSAPEGKIREKVSTITTG